MLLNKLKHVVGLTALALLVIGAGMYLGRVPAEEPKAGDTLVTRAAEAPKAQPADSSKAGRIYYHLNYGLASVQPDGEKTMHLAKPVLEDLQGYQLLSDRLSPDAKRMAFGKAVMTGNGVGPPDKLCVRDAAKEEAGEVVVTMDGSEIHNFAWSPDGSKLAFSTWDKENNTRNWVVDVKTKKTEEVKLPRYKFEDKENMMGVEAWSPDGKWFLANGNGLHVVKTDGTGAKRVTKAEKDILTGSCSFSPDGRKVLFVMVHDNHSMTLHAAEVDGGKEWALLDAMNFTDVHGCWSPDGRRVAYTATPLDSAGKRQGETSLYVIDADGKNSTTLLTEKHDPGLIWLRLVDWR